MSQTLDGISISAAVRSQADQIRWMRAVNASILRLRNLSGDALVVTDDPSMPAAAAATPPQVGLAVAGVDGSFEITLTLPQDVKPLSVSLFRASILGDNNQLGATMLHQLQSATSVNFDAASGVVTYGPFSDLFYKIQAPNQTLFWRVQSSFDGVNWNDWLIYSSAATCGPVGVNSGFLRSTSAAANGVLNTTNAATVNSIDNGTSATIQIFGTGGVGSAWIHFDGQNNQTSIPAGSIAGVAYGTTFLVYYNPTSGAYQAFNKTAQFPSSLFDPLLWAGQVTTVTAGGGGGTSGGGGASGGGLGGGRAANL